MALIQVTRSFYSVTGLPEDFVRLFVSKLSEGTRYVLSLSPSP